MAVARDAPPAPGRGQAQHAWTAGQSPISWRGWTPRPLSRAPPSRRPDLSPINRSMRKESFPAILTRGRTSHETQAILRRTDHLDPQRTRGRRLGGRPGPHAWRRRAVGPPLEVEVRRHDGARRAPHGPRRRMAPHGPRRAAFLRRRAGGLWRLFGRAAGPRGGGTSPRRMEGPGLGVDVRRRHRAHPPSPTPRAHSRAGTARHATVRGSWHATSPR